MASATNSSRASDTTGASRPAADAQRRLLDAPFEAAQQPARDATLELTDLLSALPTAFLSSQQRELDRLKQTGKKDDPRILQLQASIEEVAGFAGTASRGRARIERLLGALGEGDGLVHGVVSDSALQPVAGLTVRLVSEARGVSRLSAKTDAEGYFRIDGATTGPGDAPTANAGSLSQRIAAWFWATPPASQEPPDDNEQLTATIEIMQKDQVIYRDPALIALNQGNVYREFVVNVAATEKPPDNRSTPTNKVATRRARVVKRAAIKAKRKRRPA